MAQAGASGLVEGARRLSGAVSGWINSIPTPQRRPDTSWHDDMVRRANADFQAKAAAEAVAKQPVKRTPKRSVPRSAGKRR
jgi:hypothetical protein